ncbi:hypothetical protein [Desulfitibacter alkalitolerans]|uniref:hypothetical protein n=1 Tax=Desulfitibacter alkalitolerans TaxID=264641 RepID=UPI00048087B2|nr:hypothetical protein [Desulfitibacter alkalitolerans]
MHELLETLLPKFNQAFKSNVKITEVTVFSLQLSVKEALIMTNRQIYLLKKSFLGMKTYCFPLGEVDLRLTENELRVTSEQHSFNTTIKILDSRKRSLLTMALEKFSQIKNQS